jgi:xanthine/uracil/vitamin C permease (AzgA family)
MTSLETIFDLKNHDSSVRVESLAGVTTFLAMA